MTTSAGKTHDIELVLPDGTRSGFALTRDEEGRTAWRRRTASLTPSSAPPGPASTQTFPPEIRQEIKLRTGHAGIGLLRHQENSGFVGEAKGVDTRWPDVFIPGPQPKYVGDVDILAGAGAMEAFTAGVPDGWTNISAATITEENTIIHGGGASVKIVSAGAGDMLEFGLAHGSYLQCRIIATGWVYVPTGSGDPTCRLANSIGDITSAPTTKDAWVQVTLTLDVSTAAMSNLDLEFEPPNGDTMYADDWTVYIDFFTGPPGPFAQMKISAVETLFMASARTLWQVAPTTGAFTAKDLAPANIKDLELFDDRLYSAIGASNSFEHSTDGATWAANALSGDDRFADGFAISENDLGRPILWKWLSPNKLAASTTPLVSGSWMHWTIGDSDTNILAVIPMADGPILIAKEDGVYHLGASGIPRNITPSWRLGRFDKQGAGGAEWLGSAYVPSGRASIWELNTQEFRHRRVNPATLGSGPEIYSGRASRLHGDGAWLHAFLTKPGASNQLTEYMAGAPGVNGNWSWAHLAELDAGEVEYSWLTNEIGIGPRLYFGSRDVAVGDVAVASQSASPGTTANTDNGGGKAWVSPDNAKLGDDSRASWPAETFLDTAETIAGTAAAVDYAAGETWTDPNNILAADDTYATVVLDSENTGNQEFGTAAGSTWTNPDDALLNEGSPVSAYTASLAAWEQSGWLELTNLGLSVPDDAEILGVSVYVVSRRDASSEAGVLTASLLKAGSTTGSGKDVKAWTAGEGTGHYGNTAGDSSDLWSATLTPADVNGTGFGVALRFQHYAYLGNFLTGYVQYATIRVTYRRRLSDGLRATNFGFTLPTEANITKIDVVVHRKADVADIARIGFSQLVVGGVLAGTPAGEEGDRFGTSEAAQTLSDRDAALAVTLTPAQVNASDFGIEIKVQGDAGEGNVTASIDAIYITVRYTLDEVSDFIDVSNFGFTIPSSATIDGVVVSVERRGALLAGGAGTVRDTTVQLLKGGVATGDNKAETTLDWPAADTVQSYGSTTDGWGATLAATDLNLSDFGVRLAVEGHVGVELAEIDHVTITVYYTAVGGSELNNRAGYVTVPSTANPRFCFCYEFASDVTMRTGVLNRFPGWKTSWQEVIIKSSNQAGEALGSAGRQVKVRYNTFDGTGWKEVGGSGSNVANTSPLHTLYFKSATVAEVLSEDIEIEIEIEQTDGVVVVEEISVVGTVRPPAVEVFSFTVIIGDGIQARGGRTHQLKAAQLAVLRGMNNPAWPVTLYDRDGTAHQCYVLTDGGVDEQDIVDYSDGHDSPKVLSAVSLTMFKVPNSDSWPS